MLSKEIYDITKEAEYFITHLDEKLLFARRRHIFVLLAPLTGSLLLITGFLFSLFTFQKLLPLFIYPTLLLGIILILLLIGLSMIIKIFVDWYFHIYIITSQKLLEVCYKPFFSKNICVIPLDQMRCAEVNVITHGFIKTLLDIGDVSITIDLLTHQDVFTMRNIVSPQKAGIELTTNLNQLILPRGVNESSFISLPNQYARNLPEEQNVSIVETIQFPEINIKSLQKNVHTIFQENNLLKGG